MRESGTVVKTDSKLATVRIERHSACGKCGICGMSDKNKHIDFVCHSFGNSIAWISCHFSVQVA